MAGGGGGESGDGDIGFQIAPMVDVVFVLLLFFMATAGSQIVEKELSVNLPSGATAPGADAKTPIVIDITADGRVLMNTQEYGAANDKDLNNLRDWFRSTIEKFGAEDPVIITPDMQATHERIMDVLNAAAASGVKKLTFG